MKISLDYLVPEEVPVAELVTVLVGVDTTLPRVVSCEASLRLLLILRLDVADDLLEDGVGGDDLGDGLELTECCLQ